MASGQPVICLNLYYRFYILLNPFWFSATDTSSNINITITDNTNQAFLDEGSAVRDIRIFLEPCHSSCSSCLNEQPC
jgi:hypothetical protein